MLITMKNEVVESKKSKTPSHTSIFQLFTQKYLQLSVL